jgi:hypothetical protein
MTERKIRATAEAALWSKGSNSVQGDGGVAGPSAALRCAQDDKFVLGQKTGHRCLRARTGYI